MISSLLIANRGEIACRIIRTARRMGVRTIAVYSDADAHAPHVALADHAVHIGPAPALQSYLVPGRIIAAAKETGAAAIHPGYGFLSENAAFAEACAAAGIIFVGPPPSAIRAMGLKDEAKAIMQKAGVPVVPGYQGERQEPDYLQARAIEIGFPVLVKAVAGGGGKGMRRVDRAEDFADSLTSAQREARNAFGNDRVLIEKYVTDPRHVEVQVFGDTHGNAVHLFERDCSLQRRHQKVIEEAPAPGISAGVRAAMGAAAVAAARAVGYSGAGTVEFIADGSRGLREDAFFFMEMNTRLQVEHPVTEMITGLDLVEWQLRVASGEALPLQQDKIALHGHSVEARVYAEDPESGFLPSTGHIHALVLPRGEGIRVDAGVAAGGEVTPFYDPMIAKVIAYGATRTIALDRLSNALAHTIVAGPRTNIAFLKALCDAPAFRSEHFDTGFIDRNLDALGAAPQPADMIAIAAATQALVAPGPGGTDPWSVADGFQMGAARVLTLPVLADGKRVDMRLSWRDGTLSVAPIARADPLASLDPAPVSIATADGILVLHRGRQSDVRAFDPAQDESASESGDNVVRAPMHGKLIALLVAAGTHVDKGHKLAIVEAMKMEHTLVAPRAGIVADIVASVGAQVSLGAKIMAIHEELATKKIEDIA